VEDEQEGRGAMNPREEYVPERVEAKTDVVRCEFEFSSLSWCFLLVSKERNGMRRIEVWEFELSQMAELLSVSRIMIMIMI
jgi:hypothetical protein